MLSKNLSTQGVSSSSSKEHAFSVCYIVPPGTEHEDPNKHTLISHGLHFGPAPFHNQLINCCQLSQTLMGGIFADSSRSFFRSFFLSFISFLPSNLKELTFKQVHRFSHPNIFLLLVAAIVNLLLFCTL